MIMMDLINMAITKIQELYIIMTDLIDLVIPKVMMKDHLKTLLGQWNQLLI